jgi:hypothetical protein
MTTQEAQTGSRDSTPTASATVPRVVPVAVARAQFTGLLFRPVASAGAESRHPAVVLLPPPGSDDEAAGPLVTGLLGAGLVVMMIQWEDPPRFPEALALVPGAVAFLAASPEIDPARIGALGIDVGGDLALRSASTDPQIRSVLAFAPHLIPPGARPAPSLPWRRPHLAEWAGFLAQIDVFATLRNLATRRVRVAYAAADRTVDTDRVRQELENSGLHNAVVNLAAEGHADVATSTAGLDLAREWFATTL